MCAHVYMYRAVHPAIKLSMYIYMYICLDMSIYPCIYLHVHTYVYICMCIYKCMAS